MLNLVYAFFFKVEDLDDQCIKVTHIQDLDKYVAQCYGKELLISFIINLIDLVSNII